MKVLEKLWKTREKQAPPPTNRLQITVTKARPMTAAVRDYLPELQQEILQVIAKYEEIDIEKVVAKLENLKRLDVLDIEIPLPEPLNNEEEGRPESEPHGEASLAAQ